MWMAGEIMEAGMLAREYGENGKYAVGSEQWAAKIRRHAVKLANELESGYMELAEILYRVWDTPVDGDRGKGPIFKSWGYDSWDDWIAAELPNFNPQRAHALRRIHYILNVELKDLGDYVRRRIVGLGFSKVREIVKVLTVSNAEKWADIAEKMNVAEVTAAVQDTKKKMEEKAQQQALNGEDEELDFVPPDDAKEVKNKNFRLYLDQKDIVDKAIERAQQLSKSDKANHNLTLICMDFLANNDFRLPNDEKTQLRYIAKFEALMGKKIVMVNPVTKEVEYGYDALKVLADKADQENP